MPRKLVERKLSSVKDAGCPSNLLFVDTETNWHEDQANSNVTHHTLRLWCASACRMEGPNKTRVDTRSGTTTASFWQFVEERVDRSRPLWIFAHNLGFDLTQLGAWRAALDGTIRFVDWEKPAPDDQGGAREETWSGFVVLDDPPTILICRWRNSTAKIVMVDTLNYLPMPLAEIGGSINIPKLPMPTKDADNDAWLDYCRRDVDIVEQAVLAMIRLDRYHLLGGLRYTVASTAYHAYRHSFLKSNPGIRVHGNLEVRKMERGAYFGGIAQQFFHGRVLTGEDWITDQNYKSLQGTVAAGPIHHLDVQSFYPSVMRQNEYPCRLVCTAVAPGLNWLIRVMKTSAVIAQVQLECGGYGYPARHDGRSVRAVGRLQTTLCGPELERALKEGAIRGIGAAAVYDTDDLFTQWVDFWWTLRNRYHREGNSAFAYLCKLYLNSLYGKFGQWSTLWETDEEKQSPIPFGYWWEKQPGEKECQVWRSLGWLSQKMVAPPKRISAENCPDGFGEMAPHKRRWEHPSAFPAIAAYVTSYGREAMRSLIITAGIDNVYYSDTDSIYTNDAGLAALTAAGAVKPGELGFLRLVETANNANFRAVKDYDFGAKRIITGVPTRCRAVGERVYLVDRFAGIISTLQSGNLDTIQVTREMKDFSGHGPQGRLDDDGRVYPPVLRQF